LTSLTLLTFFTHSGNPQSIDAATELGLLYLRIGDTQRAFQQFGAALAYSPNCVKAILPMAYVMQVRKFIEIISLL